MVLPTLSGYFELKKVNFNENYIRAKSANEQQRKLVNKNC
jgi:hypothetical protein